MPRRPAGRLALHLPDRHRTTTRPAVAGGGMYAGQSVDQQTHRGTLRQWTKAIVEGDRKAFLACYDLSGHERYTSALELVFDTYCAYHRLQAAMERAYGPRAWRRYRSLGGLALIVPPRADPDWVERTLVLVDGNRATYLGYADNALYRRDGQWYFRLSGTEGATPDDVKELIQQFLDHARRALAQVGRPDVDLHDIKYEP